jgi:hypothetical protein
MRKTIQPSFADLTIANMIPADDPLKIILTALIFLSSMNFAKTNTLSVADRDLILKASLKPCSLFIWVMLLLKENLQENSG